MKQRIIRGDAAGSFRQAWGAKRLIRNFYACAYACACIVHNAGNMFCHRHFRFTLLGTHAISVVLDDGHEDLCSGVACCLTEILERILQDIEQTPVGERAVERDACGKLDELAHRTELLEEEDTL